jgi:S-adenosylmethionine:tRNA ribosyltransferase-isomerase
MPVPGDLSAWDFDLPDERIARRPAARRTGSRLMHLARAGGEPAHRSFAELPELLRPHDLLVANNSRVMAARLFATRATGGAVELLVLSAAPGPVEAIARPARKLKPGEVLRLRSGGEATVVRGAIDGVVLVQFEEETASVLAEQGQVPLPPYLGRDADASDTERYQTVFAGPLGSAAAPTAGLHFDEGMLALLRQREIGFCTVTLHVGIGTFRPLREEDLQAGVLHREPYEVPEETVAAIAAARARGGRIIAVGTTSARTLESATDSEGRLRAGPGSTTIFIQPPYTFRALDGLLTNFHLPRSSLLMMVAALVGRERLLQAYADAVAAGYRFYSYGDAMLIL